MFVCKKVSTAWGLENIGLIDWLVYFIEQVLKSYSNG